MTDKIEASDYVLVKVFRIRNHSDKSFKIKVAPKHELFLPKSLFFGFDFDDDARTTIKIAKWWYESNIDYLIHLRTHK